MNNKTLFNRRYIYPVNRRIRKKELGEKSMGLVDLMRLGLRVPKTYACSWSAHIRYKNGDASVLNDLHTELKEILVKKTKYAIRSSSNSEDMEVFSFAGQFESILNVENPEKVVEAIKSIWDYTSSLLTLPLSKESANIKKVASTALVRCKI